MSHWTRALVLALPLFAGAPPALADRMSPQEWAALEKQVEATFAELTRGATDPSLIEWYPLVDLVPRVAADDSDRAVKLIYKVCKNSQWAEGVCSAAVDAVAGMGSAEAVDYVQKTALKGEWHQQVLSIEVLGKRTDRASVDTLIACLQAREVQARASAALALGVRGDPLAIDPLIDLLLKGDRKRGVDWESARGALARLTGVELDSGGEYRTYWEMHKSDPSYRPTTGEEAGGGGGTTIFGQPITCASIVFILDISGSMEATDPYPSDWEGTTAPDPTQFKEERQRIRRAKRELRRVVGDLDKDVAFNIIAFSSSVDAWKGGLQKATASAKADAQRFVDGFEARGTTWTDSALEEAYKNEEAYCFYLLSDGDPTHEGGEPPSDTEYLQGQIYELVAARNRFRRVKLYTLGFVGANRAFMERLAEMSGGTYRDIR